MINLNTNVKKILITIGLVIFVAVALYCGYRWGAIVVEMFGGSRNTVTFTTLILFIITLLYLSHFEIKKARKQTESLEKEIEQEKKYFETEIALKANELREQKLRRLNELSKMAEFGRLSQGLFHDLMSPLSGLSLYMDRMKDMKKEEIEGSYESFNKIKNISKRMGDTIYRMKNNMSQSSIPKKCSVYKEISETLELLRFKINSEDIKISLKSHGEYFWFGDNIKLYQIFSNIISNAIDALENGEEKKIDIEIIKKDNLVRISIKDSGSGMDEKTLSKIFNPYFTTKKPERGTGVGLTIVQKIVEEIGGNIDVKSALGIGSEFIISLPSAHL